MEEQTSIVIVGPAITSTVTEQINSCTDKVKGDDSNADNSMKDVQEEVQVVEEQSDEEGGLEFYDPQAEALAKRQQDLLEL